MPKAPTGCTKTLYTALTPEGDKHLAEMVKKSAIVSGWPVTRPVYLDTLIKRQDAGMKLARPEFTKAKAAPKAAPKKAKKAKKSKK